MRSTIAMRRLGLGVLVAAFVALVASGCGSSSGDNTSTGASGGSGKLSGDAVKIGAIVPSSGPFAEWGKGNTVTLKMLQQQVNAAGGVNGVPLQIHIYDDAADPAQSANLLRKLATGDKVLAVAGPLTSSSAEVAFPIANALKIVSVAQASSKPGVAAANRPYAFRNTIDEGVLAKATVPEWKKEFQIKTAAIIYDAKDAVSSSMGTKVFPPALAAAGITALNGKNPVSFSTGDVDVTAQVTQLKSLNPDGVVIAADYSQAITVLREMHKQGLDVPVVGGTPLISSAILKAAPEIPIVAPATYFVGISDRRAKEFTDKVSAALAQAGYSGIEPNMYDANIYEIVQMFIQAIEKGGVTNDPGQLSGDREKIMNYLTDMSNFQGLSGQIRFNKDGDAIKRFYVVVGKGGNWTPRLSCTSATAQCKPE